jgi:hypothetical protein
MDISVNELKQMQEFLLMELVKTKAMLQSFIEICEAFNIVDLDIVELRAIEIEQELIMEMTGEGEVNEETDTNEWDVDTLTRMGR